MKTYTRKILLSVVFCFMMINVRAQYITIPDPNFANWLNSSVWANCMNGNQLDTTCNDLSILATIDCSGLNISDLSGIQYFSNLYYLNCSGNSLSSLPNMIGGLQELDCSYNNLTSLPAIPTDWLDCSNNNLTSLPPLGTLHMLVCENNQLTSLPYLPPTLLHLNCYSNNLSSLPALPDSMYTLQISNNPNISCLPPIRITSIFEWDGTSINCLPNPITILNWASPAIDTVPICDTINTNNCSVYWNIKGTAFIDNNSNCLVDTNEFLPENLKLNLFQNGNLTQQTITNSFGQYLFDTDTGTFLCTIDTIGLPFLVNCPASVFYTIQITPSSQYYYSKDFSINCKPGIDVGVTNIVNTSGRFRPGNNATIKVFSGDISNHYNLHCATGVSGTVTVLINGPASFSSVTPGALTPVVNGNMLTYTIADFGTVIFNSDFSFVVQTDVSAVQGDQVCFDVAVTPLAGDNNTANNNYTQCFEVRNSFDPNEKEVYPEGSIDTSQHYLTYTIYFQNTGNDTALHVYILDTLDSDIDESSIQLLAYSHEPLVQVMGNVVKFNFPNINLVDSVTDEPNSHGYVQYRVRLNDGLLPGTVINNTAHIVFDFNVPVVTNTTFNQVDITVLTPALSKGEGAIVDIYPNPVVSGGELKVVFDAGDVKGGMLNIYDMSGRKVFERKVLSSPQTQVLRLPVLSAGVYHCSMSCEGGGSNKKLVVTSAK